jgi:tRNA A-37 threonylcarbamoyl transferase component Bud32
VKCQYCGTSNRAGSSYCSHCGGAFATPAKANNANNAKKAKAAKPTPAAVGVAAAASAAASAGAAPRAAGAGARPTPSVAPRPTNPTGSLPPQTLLHQRYLVLKTVGQGGMAAVYRAVDTRTNQQVAVKEMSQDGLSPDEEVEALESFRSEAEMLQRLRHPNLPRVFEYFSEGARHYLVMEFVEGQTLEQRQQATGGKPLPEAEVLRWAGQLCSVLAYLHTQRPPIIFRDLKPANIMVTPQGQVKLIDFGIARVFHPGRLKDTQVLGTPGFAPPEQYGKAQTDPRADIYALGVTLYQLVTGYDPAATPFTLPPAHTRNPSLSPYIQAAIGRATQLNRDARYPTVGDLERELLRPEGFTFRDGQRAHTLPELLALCRAMPQEAQDHLYARRVEGWLNKIGQPQAARAAAVIVAAGGDRAAGLATFMAQASRPQAQPRPKAAPQGAPTGSNAAHVASRVVGQVASRVAAQTARRLFAQAAAAAATAVGTQILVEVRPRSVNLGALMAGQRGTMAVAVGGQNGLPVTGRITPMAPWLRADRSSFAGPSTLVQLTVDTVQLPTPGTHQTNLQITSGTQRLFVPITVEVLATRKPNAPPPTPPKPKRAPRAASSKHGAAPAAPDWIRSLLSWLAALGAAGWALQQVASAIAAHAVTLPALVPLQVALLCIMIAAAAPAAVVGRWGPDLLRRTFTAAVAAAIAAGATLLVERAWASAASPVSLPVASGHLPTVPLGLVALGLPAISSAAALGASRVFSRRMLAGFAFASRHSSILVTVIAVVVGGWLGFALTRNVFYGLLVPIGIIAGMVVAVLFTTRANRLLQRVAGHP